MSQGYAGDINPAEAWKTLKSDPNAQLVDVRTAAEWQFVGVPVLAELDKDPVLAEWIKFPGGAPNPDFVDQVQAAIPAKDAPILFLCRSGVRSIGAATALTAAGYTHCFNVLEGFEGDKDANGQRATLGGWKKAGLPWAQG